MSLDVKTYTGENPRLDVKTYTKADEGKLSKVIDYGNGSKVEIPINQDGSVKWFDDLKLIKKDHNK